MLIRNVLSVVVVSAMALVVVGAQTVTPRVYVTDSESWESRGRVLLLDDGVGGSAGGARPQTAEIMKTFGERCPGVRVNRNPEKADFVVVLDHEGGKLFFQRDNKVVIFNREGDMIHSGSTRSLGNSVKNACQAIVGVWPDTGRAAGGL